MKNNKKNKTAPKAKTSTQTHAKPGRPRYVPKIPRGKFTFSDLEVENGVDPKTGKGENCTRLTLRKWSKDELKNTRSGLIIRIKDALAQPNNEKGLGRKAFVFQKRVGATAGAPKASAPKAPKTEPAEVSVNVGLSEDTQAYEATKAALLGTTTEAVVIAPEPVTETPAPVAETPAPEQPVTEPVAEPVLA